MILHAVHCRGSITNDEWSIVTIHKSREGAVKAMLQYENNCSKEDVDNEYCVYEIDTETPNDCIYDYGNV